jgi:hypothetical protein
MLNLSSFANVQCPTKAAAVAVKFFFFFSCEKKDENDFGENHSAS